MVVNCARGRSRSVSVVLFFAMRHMDMTLREAYAHVKKIRPLIGPSKHLRPQLSAAEQHVRGQVTLEPATWKADGAAPMAPAPRKWGRSTEPLTTTSKEIIEADFAATMSLSDGSARSQRKAEKRFLSRYRGTQAAFAKQLVLQLKDDQ